MKASTKRTSRRNKGFAPVLFLAAIGLAGTAIAQAPSQVHSLIASSATSVNASGTPLSSENIVALYLDKRSFSSASRSKRNGLAASLDLQILQARAAVDQATFDGKAAVEIAASLEGVPYRFGGATPNAFDCSGYTKYVLGKLGYDVDHFAESQYRWATPVSRADVKVGDLVFIHESNGYVYHVGIYAGNGQMWHAPKPGGSVEKTALFGSVSFGTVPHDEVAAAALEHVKFLETALAAQERGLPV